VEQRQQALLDRVSALSEEVAQSDWRTRIGNKMDSFRSQLFTVRDNTAMLNRALLREGCTGGG
jgi:hypothetical protein